MNLTLNSFISLRLDEPRLSIFPGGLGYREEQTHRETPQIPLIVLESLLAEAKPCFRNGGHLWGSAVGTVHWEGRRFRLSEGWGQP